MRAIRRLLMIQIALFAFAALMHFGVLFTGHQHAAARIAETVIGAVLTAGLLAGVIRPGWTRAAAIAVQAFALLGTCVGIVMITIGIGPRTMLDAALHASMTVALITGLWISANASPRGAGKRTVKPPPRRRKRDLSVASG